jgi:hypothetical protein
MPSCLLPVNQSETEKRNDAPAATTYPSFANFLLFIFSPSNDEIVLHAPLNRSRPPYRACRDGAQVLTGFRHHYRCFVVIASHDREFACAEGPFTVFAPTDEAFAKLPAGTVESLLLPENKEKLIAVLTYHVVAGKVLASDVVKLKSAKTVNGKEAMIKVSDKGVTVDAARVVATDIEASNGVIHVIDSVILP